MKSYKGIWTFTFFVYICALLHFVVIKFDRAFGPLGNISSTKRSREMGIWNYNMEPFQTITPYLRSITNSYAYINIFGNIIAFVPLGFLIPIIFKNMTFAKTMLVCFVSIVGIESFQFITMVGSFDIDDIILNMLGSFIGYGGYVLLEKILKMNPAFLHQKREDNY